MRDYEELVKALRDPDNANVLDDVDDAADAIEELLARNTAFWVDTQPHLDDSNYRKDGMSYYCSNCKHRAGKYKHRTYQFCPWCGAKIIKKGENADDQQYQLHG